MSAPTLPPAVSGELRETRGRAGRLAYYVAGHGAPMLLVHSVNAAASAYEVRPVFERLKESRRVYAVDLPGYGHSDRSDRRYDVGLFVAAVDDMLDLIALEQDRPPPDVLALSLAAEFAARAAARRPERFASLALVTPTGFRRGSGRLRGPEGATREVPGLHRTVSFPLWRGALFKALVSRASIAYFLRRTFGSDAVEPGLIDYAYATSHQPGASRAPFAFLSGRLFSADIRAVYERLTCPVWLAHGTRGDFGDFSEADWVRTRPNWTVQSFDTGAMPYFEQPDAFFASYRGFLQRVGRPGPPPVSRQPLPA
jgi:pimeloyl-ACP methyl ester carboxylesterase